VQPVGGGGDALRQQPLAQEGVDQRRLAGVELAQRHQVVEPVQVLDAIAKAGQVLFGGAA